MDVTPNKGGRPRKAKSFCAKCENPIARAPQRYVVRTWKKDGSTNIMELEVAARNIVRNLPLPDGLGEQAMKAIESHVNRLLLHGKRLETLAASFRVIISGDPCNLCDKCRNPSRIRKCLKCDESFESFGNFLCPPCDRSNSSIVCRTYSMAWDL